jgi:hypothetical protein
VPGSDDVFTHEHLVSTRCKFWVLHSYQVLQIKVHTSIPPFLGAFSTVEVGGMDAGRVEGAFETCVLVGKFIGVLESFNPPLS